VWRPSRPRRRSSPPRKELEKFQSEFCDIKKKYESARERLENDVKEITELIVDREGAYNDYQDASALKYSHVQATARNIVSKGKEKNGLWGLLGL